MNKPSTSGIWTGTPDIDAWDDHDAWVSERDDNMAFAVLAGMVIIGMVVAVLDPAYGVGFLCGIGVVVSLFAVVEARKLKRRTGMERLRTTINNMADEGETR